MTANITIVRARNDSDEAITHEAKQAFAVLLRLHQEAGFPEDTAPFDPGKAFTHVWHTVNCGWVVYAVADDGIVGILGLMKVGVWYSKAHMIRDQFLYIDPEHRGGAVLQALLAEAKAIATAEGCLVALSVPNVRKTLRPARSTVDRVGAILSFNPRGAAYAVHPAGTE